MGVLPAVSCDSLFFFLYTKIDFSVQTLVCEEGVSGQSEGENDLCPSNWQLNLETWRRSSSFSYWLDG